MFSKKEIKQMKFEIVKDILAGCATRISTSEINNVQDNGAIKNAVKIANAVINQLGIEETPEVSISK